jgi:hypothetical protein
MEEGTKNGTLLEIVTTVIRIREMKEMVIGETQEKIPTVNSV